MALLVHPVVLICCVSLGLAAPAGARAEAPAEAELLGLTYTGVRNEPVTLVDGVWEGEPWHPDGAARPRVVLVRGLQRRGDLDGDGRDETVALLAESSGGTGVVTHLAAVARRDGAPFVLGTAPVDDRVQVRALRVADGRVEIELVLAGPDDALCCPTQLATRVYALEDGALREVSRQVTGRLTLGALEGSEWVLAHFARDEPLPDGARVTLAFRDGRLAGSSGCNRYTVAPRGAGAGDLSLGPIAGTRRACPEPAAAVETRYLAALEAVTRFGFWNGRLSLTWVRDGAPQQLLFEPAPAGP